MGVFALFRRGCKLVADVAVLLLLVAFIPGIPPNVTFTSFELPEERPLTGPLAPNNILDQAERLLEGEIVSPESIASRSDDEIFIGVSGGKVMRLSGKNFEQVQTVANFGQKCERPWSPTCGHPLGMRFAPNGALLLADPYMGILSVNVDTGETECLINATKEIDGIRPMLPDDLDIDAEGNIYWSDASAVSGLFSCTVEMFSDGTGRLIKYDPKTKKNTVLVKNLNFANGVQLTPGGESVLVCESNRNRVWRHWLKGPKAGATEVFVDRLPGMPDNIRAKSDGGYYVSLVLVKAKNGYDWQRILGQVPWVRKLYIRLAYLIKMMCDAVTSVYPNEVTEWMSFKSLSLGIPVEVLFGKNTIVVELDAKGNIVGSLQGETGKVSLISETRRVGDNLFFGTPFNNFVGRLYVGAPDEKEWLTPEQIVGRQDIPMEKSKSNKNKKSAMKDEL